MATNNDRIEKLELEIQELKEVMQKMNTESQSSFAELKELFFKGFEHGWYCTTILPRATTNSKP
jgi:hypothetical protein